MHRRDAELKMLCIGLGACPLEPAPHEGPDSKTPNGAAEVPLTDIAADALGNQLAISGPGLYLFPSDENASGHQKTFKTAWPATLRRAKVPYFRIHDLRSTYATRLSADGVADEW